MRSLSFFLSLSLFLILSFVTSRSLSLSLCLAFVLHLSFSHVNAYYTCQLMVCYWSINGHQPLTSFICSFSFHLCFLCPLHLSLYFPLCLLFISLSLSHTAKLDRITHIFQIYKTLLLDGLHLLSRRLLRFELEDFPTSLSCQNSLVWQRGIKITQNLRQVRSGIS